MLLLQLQDSLFILYPIEPFIVPCSHSFLDLLSSLSPASKFTNYSPYSPRNINKISNNFPGCCSPSQILQPAVCEGLRCSSCTALNFRRTTSGDEQEWVPNTLWNKNENQCSSIGDSLSCSFLVPAVKSPTFHFLHLVASLANIPAVW